MGPVATPVGTRRSLPLTGPSATGKITRGNRGPLSGPARAPTQAGIGAPLPSSHSHSCPQSLPSRRWPPAGPDRDPAPFPALPAPTLTVAPPPTLNRQASGSRHIPHGQARIQDPARSPARRLL